MKPTRRWFQFSLRTLLLFVLLVSLSLSWFAVKRQQATRQEKAVEAIRKAGGNVAYDYYNLFRTRRFGNHWPGRPAWLREFLR